MALKVEEWHIDRLVEYARNPRKNDFEVGKMASAIKEFGFRIPIVAKSDGTIIDGHLRLKGARKLGLKTVPVALADDLTEAQIKAFRLLANKSAFQRQDGDPRGNRRDLRPSESPAHNERIFKYVRHTDVGAHIEQGWVRAADIAHHSAYSILMEFPNDG